MHDMFFFSKLNFLNLKFYFQTIENYSHPFTTETWFDFLCSKIPFSLDGLPFTLFYIEILSVIKHSVVS